MILKIYSRKSPTATTSISFLTKKPEKLGILTPSKLKLEINKLSDKRGRNISKLSDKKLKTSELFAGCDGLSEGLVQSRVAELKWAVERDYTFASSYAKNNRCTNVFHRNYNKLLNEMRESKVNKTNTNPYYPKAGKVELLCGGPPCQVYGNRLKSGDYSEDKRNMLDNFVSFVNFLNHHYIFLKMLNLL